MKIRAVFIDMDGTLLCKSKVFISKRNMAALHSAMEKGVHIIPCTGRCYGMLPPQIQSLQGLRYFVTGHGARAYDQVEQVSLYENLISAEDSVKILRVLEGKGVYMEIAANRTIFMEKAVVDDLDYSVVPEHHVWYVRDRLYTPLEKPSEYFRENGLRIEKINTYNMPAHLHEPLYRELNEVVSVHHTFPGAGKDLEFYRHDMKKLRATDAILNQLGISYEETMGIGDSVSDLDILQNCGVGVAMGNAPDDIKQAANDVTASNMEDGVALALEKYVL